MRGAAARAAVVVLGGKTGRRRMWEVRVAMSLAHRPRTSPPPHTRRERRVGRPRACAREGMTARHGAYPQSQI
jgi:hypothetical protein